LQDVPLITNIGTEFTIKPVNYFDHLASMDIVDSDDFASCAASQGAKAFDYVYAADGSNTAGDKSGFKYSGPLESRDVFVATKPLRPAGAPTAGMSGGQSPKKAPATAG
jgi:hypothetical protein